MAESNAFDDVLHSDQACFGLCLAGAGIRVVHKAQVHPRAKESQRPSYHNSMDLNLGCGRHLAFPCNSANFLHFEPQYSQWNQLGQTVH